MDNAISLLHLNDAPVCFFMALSSPCRRPLPLSSLDPLVYTLPMLLLFASVNLIFWPGFHLFHPCSFSWSWQQPDTLCSGSPSSKRRIGKNRDCLDLLAGLRKAEEQEENSLVSFLVRAIPNEAVGFSQALRGCTNLTSWPGHDSLRQGWR